MKRLLSASLLALLVLGTALPALAHKVQIFAYSDTETIFVEAQFSKSSPAIQCPVELTDSSGAVLGSCVTDETGLCEIPVPEGATGELTVTVNAGEGHLGSWTLMESDYQ